MDQCRQVYCRVVRIVGVQIVSLFKKKIKRISFIRIIVYSHIKKKGLLCIMTNVTLSMHVIFILYTF